MLFFTQKIITRRGKITSDQTGIRRPQYGQIYSAQQTLLLLERLEQMIWMRLPAAVSTCTIRPEALYAMLNAQIGEENA
ncbi:hypothetical protein [Enterobacter roggenkampii]|uniref:hypothetical protein n=1 Tax=Enterobacter roggenkampii TaxID=1812935 RepID=UPI00389B15EF